MTPLLAVTVPVLELTNPAAALLPTCGADQPPGTVIVSLPLVMPVPAGGV